MSSSTSVRLRHGVNYVIKNMCDKIPLVTDEWSFEFVLRIFQNDSFIKINEIIL